MRKIVWGSQEKMNLPLDARKPPTRCKMGLIGVAICLLLAILACEIPGQNAEVVVPAGQNVMQTYLAETLEAAGVLHTSGNDRGVVIYFPLLNFQYSQDGIIGGIDENVGIATVTSMPSETPTITKTPTPQDTPTPTMAPCLIAQFIQHINVPPGTVFTGGTKFTKIWRVQNVGSCPWNRNFTLVLVSGTGLGAKDQVALSAVVASGDYTDIMIDLTAPKTDGKYTSAWMIYNAAGQVFGVGSKGTEYLWVDIKVKNQSTAAARSPTSKPSATSKPSSTTKPPATIAPTATATSTLTYTPTLTETPTPTTP